MSPIVPTGVAVVIMKVSIEYSHIYTSQAFGVEQLDSIELMKSKENELKKEGHSVSRHILVDNYSTATGINRFDLSSFKQSLVRNKAYPDLILEESKLVNICEEVASKVSNKSLKKSLINYYKTRSIWPCSLCVAAWYLIRLGAIEYSTNLSSDRIISILPDRFKTAEEEAKNIIASTEFGHLLDRIEVVFFGSTYDDYSDWSEFDTQEYVARNYTNNILPEDEELIRFATTYLQENVNLNSLNSTVDVGVGPNLYPSMMVAPYISDKGEICLIDPVKANRDYVTKQLQNMDHWNEFNNFLSYLKPEIYKEDLTLKSVSVTEGDIFDLPENNYDLVMSFFVAESITDDLDDVGAAIERLKNAVKPGGVLITGHALGSHGYFAGMLTSFPATPIDREYLEKAYANFNNVEILTISHNVNYNPRKNYKGMAAVGVIKPH